MRVLVEPNSGGAVVSRAAMMWICGQSAVGFCCCGWEVFVWRRREGKAVVTAARARTRVGVLMVVTEVDFGEDGVGFGLAEVSELSGKGQR